MHSLEDVLAVHESLCNDARNLVSAKGHDYNSQQQAGGNTLANLEAAARIGIVDTPATGILVRLMDKLMRLASLRFVDPAVKNESIRDTIVDVINYSVYLYVFLNAQKQEEKAKHEEWIKDWAQAVKLDDEVPFAARPPIVPYIIGGDTCCGDQVTEEDIGPIIGESYGSVPCSEVEIKQLKPYDIEDELLKECWSSRCI